MNFYVLVATAVYDQGAIGVFATEQLARDAAEEIWPKTDGHHRFRIDVCELDRIYEDVFPHVFLPSMDNALDRDKRRGDRPPDVELHLNGVSDV